MDGCFQGTAAGDSAISRRRFLYSMINSAACAGLAPALAGQSFGAGLGALPVAVFSKVYQEVKLDFAQSAEVTAEAGLDGIDCAVRPGGEITPEKAADQMPRYAEALRAHGVKMLLLTTGIQEVSSPCAGEILRTAKGLGIRHYRLGYWRHHPDKSAEMLVKQIRSSLKDLAAMNKNLEICGVLQNHSAPKDHSRRNAGCDLVELYDIVKDFNPDQIGVAFDLGHAIVEHGDQWREHFERIKSHIRVVYIKDVQRPSRFVPFGQGEFGRTGFFQLLSRMNYQGPLSLHIEFDWAPQSNKTRAGLIQVLKESRRTLGQWLAGTA
jgi:L-ribulose-5-phosphate 3-epimerase